ncbi:hypothetical protein A2U01_0013427, partial [Trifolium medium]|nr:hypothetical protein [Trifolium medium]
ERTETGNIGDFGAYCRNANCSLHTIFPGCQIWWLRDIFFGEMKQEEVYRRR